MPTIKPGEAATIFPIYYPHCLDLSQQDSQKILKHTDLISAFIQYKSLSSFSSLLTPPGSCLVPHSERFDSPGSSTLTVLPLGDLDVSSLLVMPTDAKKIWIFLRFSWLWVLPFFFFLFFCQRSLFLRFVQLYLISRTVLDLLYLTLLLIRVGARLQRFMSRTRIRCAERSRDESSRSFLKAKIKITWAPDS